MCWMILTPTSNFPRWDRPTKSKRKLTAMLILFSPTLLNGVTLLDPFKLLNLRDQRLLWRITSEKYIFLIFVPGSIVNWNCYSNKRVRTEAHWGNTNKNWYPTNPDEIKALIGIQIVMGVLQPPSQDVYWYKDKLFHQSIIEMKFICFSLYHWKKTLKLLKTKHNKSKCF